LFSGDKKSFLDSVTKPFFSWHNIFFLTQRFYLTLCKEFLVARKKRRKKNVSRKNFLAPETISVGD